MNMTLDELLMYAFCKNWLPLIHLIQNHDVRIHAQNETIHISIDPEIYEKLGKNTFIEKLDRCQHLDYQRKDWHYGKIGFKIKLPKIT